MNTIFEALHILTAILFLGPVTVAVSTFPSQALRVHDGNESARGVVSTLYRITSIYGMLSLLVPMLGLGIMLSDLHTWLRNGLLHGAILVTVVAWVILYTVIIPRQKAIVGALGIHDGDEHDEPRPTINNWEKSASRLTIFSGIFCGLWVLVFILMMVL